ncbi:hypothetical protein JTB14_018044 [Gonioctena quinquepunctata]|nr:hypothetical protein JTB14_018044 [Gonioctena quinquepunctata]
MDKVFFISVVLLGTVTEKAHAKVFTKCGLAQELVSCGFEKTFVGNWVSNGGKALGLFQINSKEWCQFGRPGGKCNMKCEDFLDDDIAKDSVCAKKIQSELGFRYWEGWTRSCYGRSYPSTIVASCFPA